ncbi:MAG: hypothetical protein Q8O30_01570 [Candidatus Omnitrophota bacterium]|nr:hypothetical protein [Candidatus Omnitrophota bacterium]
MKNKILSTGLFLIFIISIAISLYGNDFINISGMQIPLVPGARAANNLTQESVQGKIANFTVNKPLAEVVNFYNSFLQANGFSVIGGQEASGSFNAAVKKDNVQFSLRIYSEGGFTYLQFIW